MRGMKAQPDLFTLRVDLEKVEALAFSSLQAFTALPHAGIPQSAALPMSVLHIFLVHQAASVCSGDPQPQSVRDGGPPRLAELRQLPDNPPRVLQVAAVHMMRLLAHMLRLLPREGHLLASAAILAR